MSDTLWNRCLLEGDELDAKVAELEGLPTGAKFAPSCVWGDGGPIIERDHIFIDPPHEAHVTGGPNGGWLRYNAWTATVSARTRKRPNPNDASLPLTVGRGAGATPLIAAMRAYVDSKA